MADTLQSLLDTVNTADNNKDLFSQQDIKALADLMDKGKESSVNYKILQNSFDNKNVYGALSKIDGLHASIHDYINSQSDKNLSTNPDLYEVCLLGALLHHQGGSVDHDALAREYFENHKKIEGTYETAQANMDENTKTEITETLNKQGQQVTEATITVSAGADARRFKNTAKAENLKNEKLNELQQLKQKFPTNTAKIDAIITELNTKATTISPEKNDQGNQYLIIARIAEGFVEALTELAKQMQKNKKKEPSLNLAIDRANSKIGDTSADVVGDRYIKMDIALTVEAVEKTPVVKAETPVVKTETPVVKAETPVVKTDIPVVKTTEKVEIAAETLQLENDLKSHFTLNGIEIGTLSLTPVGGKKNEYNAIVNNYAGFVIKQDTVKKTIEIISSAGVRKGLLAYDLSNHNTSVKTNITSKEGEQKKDIALVFNDAKSKTYINTLLPKNNGVGGAYTVDAVKENQMTLDYTNNIIDSTKEKTEGSSVLGKKDTLIVKIDPDTNMIELGSQTGKNIEYQKVQGQNDIVLSGDYSTSQAGKVTYYAKTEGDITQPSIRIATDITGTVDENGAIVTKAVDPEYNKIKNITDSIEDLQNKVNFTYNTPGETLIETQFEKSTHGTLVDKNKNSYAIRSDFQLPNQKTTSLSIPVQYILGSKENNNKSSLRFQGSPILTYTDANNTVISNNEIMLDGIVYTIDINNINNNPIVSLHNNPTRTLEEREKQTKTTISSDIFGKQLYTDTTHRLYDSTKIDVGMGNARYEAIQTQKGWKEGDQTPVSYKRKIIVGEVRDGTTVIHPGTVLGEADYDKYGNFQKATIADDMKTFSKQKSEVQLTGKQPIGLTNNDHNVIVQPKLNTASQTLDMNSIDKNSPTSTGYIKEYQDGTDNKASFKNRTELYKEIGQNKIKIYDGLKHLSGHDTDGDHRTFFQKIFGKKENGGSVINLPTEEDTNVNTVLGPDRKGIYTYRLIEASSDKKGTYPAQYIYVKPINGVLSLCNQKGDAIGQQKILLPGTNDYYNLSVNADSFQLGGKEKELQSRRPTLVDKRGDKLPTTSCSFLAPLSETKTLYRFTNSELSLRDVMTIEVDQPKDGAITLSGEDKLANLAAFQTLDTTKSGIASYRDLFDTNNTVYQALRHSDYETTFSTLYQTYAKTEKTDDLVQMKVLDKQSGKRYYKPYHISKDKDGKFVMTESPGRQKTYDVMRQRLDRIAEAHKIALMQEKSLDPKGNTMRGWYTTNPIAKSLQDYLQDDKKPIEFTLRTNHKQGGEYEKHTLYYSPQKDTISFSSDKQESSKTIEDINYSISFNKKDMGIVIKKGTYTPSGG